MSATDDLLHLGSDPSFAGAFAFVQAVPAVYWKGKTY